MYYGCGCFDSRATCYSHMLLVFCLATWRYVYYNTIPRATGGMNLNTAAVSYSTYSTYISYGMCAGGFEDKVLNSCGMCDVFAASVFTSTRKDCCHRPRR